MINKEFELSNASVEMILAVSEYTNSPDKAISLMYKLFDTCYKIRTKVKGYNNIEVDNIFDALVGDMIKRDNHIDALMAEIERLKEVKNETKQHISNSRFIRQKAITDKR